MQENKTLKTMDTIKIIMGIIISIAFIYAGIFIK